MCVFYSNIIIIMDKCVLRGSDWSFRGMEVSEEIEFLLTIFAIISESHPFFICTVS